MTSHAQNANNHIQKIYTGIAVEMASSYVTNEKTKTN